jgi:hypothetical protein
LGKKENRHRSGGALAHRRQTGFAHCCLTSIQQADQISVPIEKCILIIRDQKVILDYDMARLYGVATKVLNQALKRNRERFPGDFFFQLTQDEKDELVTNCDRFKKLKHSSVLPSAFTEHGAIMAATVLSSPRAILASIYVVRAFVHLRTMVTAHQEIMKRLDKLESGIEIHDSAIRSLFEAMKRLMAEPKKGNRKIGFITDKY